MPPYLHLLFFLLLLLLHPTTSTPSFREAPSFRNHPKTCPEPNIPTSLIHIAMTLDFSSPYLRGSIAAILSILQHSSCPQNTIFHFLASPHHHKPLTSTLTTTFPYLTFHLYPFHSSTVRHLITTSLRRALDQPLNYARIYLPDLLPSNLTRVVYLDSDLIVVDDIANLYYFNLNNKPLGAPEYCHANFSTYFTPAFWNNPDLSSTFDQKLRKPCYFNTGVMVIDLSKWREEGYTKKLVKWMKIQKKCRIYELGSLPPFLLVFAGKVEGVEHRWNQHGLGGDNVEGLCRDLHPGPVSLLHWSGKGKPWLRLDAKKACTLDYLWAPYDLFVRYPVLFSDT